jgi:hypothetical protein
MHAVVRCTLRVVGAAVLDRDVARCMLHVFFARTTGHGGRMQSLRVAAAGSWLSFVR